MVRALRFLLIFSCYSILLPCIELRNFAATQTKGVSSAIYNKFDTKAEAEAAYRTACQNGYVQVL
jgi:hypothetical protein